MCFLIPQKVKSINGSKVILSNGIQAFYDKKIGKLNVNDEVIVYGNLIINKHNSNEKSQ
jgi:hypothetical protein